MISIVDVFVWFIIGAVCMFIHPLAGIVVWGLGYLSLRSRARAWKDYQESRAKRAQLGNLTHEERAAEYGLDYITTSSK